MSKLAAVFGSYVDMQFKRGLKVARVFVDIPIEKSEEFIRMFGTPVGADPVPVVIARLEASATVDVGKGAYAPSLPAKPVSAEPESKPEHERSRSQIAALKLQDEAFKSWLVDTYWTGKEEIGDYDGLLKRALGITSKKELDVEGPAAERWDRMLASFQYRHTVRA